eukprot:2151168-Amphidinium_carterae.1
MKRDQAESSDWLGSPWQRCPLQDAYAQEATRIDIRRLAPAVQVAMLEVKSSDRQFRLNL